MMGPSDSSATGNIPIWPLAGAWPSNYESSDSAQPFQAQPQHVQISRSQPNFIDRPFYPSQSVDAQTSGIDYPSPGRNSDPVESSSKLPFTSFATKPSSLSSSFPAAPSAQSVKHAFTSTRLWSRYQNLGG